MNMFCRIYVGGTKTKESIILDFVSDILETPVSNAWHIENKEFSLSVDRNDEYNFDKSKGFPDGFLYFQFSLSIDFIENIDILRVVGVINKVLEYLWANNYPAVAACDYEELLTEKGGYMSTNVPWVN